MPRIRTVSRGASGHVIRIVSPSSTQTVAGFTRTRVPAGRVGTVRLVAHRAYQEAAARASCAEPRGPRPREREASASCGRTVGS